MHHHHHVRLFKVDIRN